MDSKDPVASEDESLVENRVESRVENEDKRGRKHSSRTLAVISGPFSEPNTAKLLLRSSANNFSIESYQPGSHATNPSLFTAPLAFLGLSEMENPNQSLCTNAGRALTYSSMRTAVRPKLVYMTAHCCSGPNSPPFPPLVPPCAVCSAANSRGFSNTSILRRKSSRIPSRSSRPGMPRRALFPFSRVVRADTACARFAAVTLGEREGLSSSSGCVALMGGERRMGMEEMVASQLEAADRMFLVRVRLARRAWRVERFWRATPPFVTPPPTPPVTPPPAPPSSNNGATPRRRARASWVMPPKPTLRRETSAAARGNWALISIPMVSISS
mmetsp:Transcript_61917/g.72397  ORF Transcript_61917/g.72397 Transcript_61917/m.72397 type:complete len:328 (+) Transcript_61917:199-1182(+)